METLAVILARAGSKGLPDKCVRPLLGRALIEYTFDHALASRHISDIVLTTDSAAAKQLAAARGIAVVDRPPALADDQATVDAAARHAVEIWEQRTQRRAGLVVLLYANIPVRAAGAIDRAIEQIEREGGTSVRSVAPIGRHHPDWLHRLDGSRMVQFRKNSIHRRQDLEPLFYHDGAVIVVTRDALFGADPSDAQSFLGGDRRALVQRCEDAVDVDEPADLALAEVVLRGPTGGAAAGSEVKFAIRIGRRQIGPGQPTYVIAEAGVNHNGSLDLALALVDIAVHARADAVKFQMFKAADLTCADAPAVEYQRRGGARTQRELLKGLELDDAAFERIAAYCRERGIEFLATPFGVADVRSLVRLGAPAIKLASTDLTNVPLVDAAIETGLPLLISTGAATVGEIDAAVARLRGRDAWSRTVLLHCVSAYPTPPGAANLRAVTALAGRFGCAAGYSDHTQSLDAGALAVACGACVLEKHFTLDSRSPGPDHAMSLEPGPLREYVARARAAETMLGGGSLGLSELERDVRAAARRGLVFARTLPAGTQLAPDMLVAKRPAGEIGPEELERVVGRTVTADVGADTPLRWEMLR